MDCKVLSVTSDQSKVETLRNLGADAVEVLSSRGAAFHRQASSFKADVAFETVGAPYLDSSLRSVKNGGRVVLIGNVSNGTASFKLGLMILNELSLVCFFFFFFFFFVLSRT